MCGRLRCCLVYEYDQYAEARKGMPKRNKRVITPMGEGRVVDVLPLKQTILVAFEDGNRAEFPRDQVQPYEEVKALEEKSQAPCDRGANGDCDCGQGEGKG